MQTTNNTPAGYRLNAQGHLVPETNIAEIDKIRDSLVTAMVEDAWRRSLEMAVFKRLCHTQIASFVELAAQDHGISMGGSKGNVCLVSFDGRYKIIRAVDETITFTEGLVVAREMIQRCIQRWSDGANSHLVTLVNKAFETDRQGNLSTARVLGLASVQIDDDEWREAIKAIHKSVQVSATKSYIRFYVRNEIGKYVQVSFDGGL